ncbi:MAG: biotin transporter BioY [Ruminiclostridium sp.]|nr:biotin transporter BioY [Ruminiclostridium sp.]
MARINVRQMVLKALFIALMVAGAYIRIPNPFFPVFITFQGVFCALAGLILGSKSGIQSISIYVLMGLIGLPVFSTPSGPQYIFQPTFGFLLGFTVAAYVTGKISEAGEKYTAVRAMVASFAGLIVIYIIGISYMYVINTFYMGTPVTYLALVSSMLLYFVKDLFLFAIAAVSSVKIRKLIQIREHKNTIPLQEVTK